VRSLEYANPLSTLPPQSDSGVTGSAATRRASFYFYFLKSLSKASRASLALRGGGVLIPGILLPGPCADEASRATVTRGEKSAQSFC
jgi:hypothetical protein